MLLVLSPLLTLAACGTTADEVDDAVGGLPGVISAEPSCHEFRCTLEIEAEPTASARELTDMVTAARTVEGVWLIDLSLTPESPTSRTSGGPSRMPVSAEVNIEDSRAADDTAVGAVLAWGVGEQDLFTLRVAHGAEDRFDVTGTGVAASSIWPLARAAWPLVEELGGATITFSQHEHLRQQSLSATESFPDALVSVAEELGEGEAGVTGVLVEPGRMMVGVINRAAAVRLRPVLADDARLAAVATEVVVTTDVLLAATAVEPGTSHRLEPVLEALDSEPDVLFATIQGNTVQAEVEGLRSFPRLVEGVRRSASAAFVDTVLVLEDPRAQHRVEITPDGDDAVLDLMLALLPTDGLRSMSVSQSEPDPTSPAVSVTVILRQPGPGTGAAPPIGPVVTRVARALATTPGNAASYRLSVTIEDAEGRASDASWLVDRTPEGLALGEVNGTEEAQAEVRAAWARGLAGS